MERGILSRSRLGSEEWETRERRDSMQSLELEKVERKDWVDSKEGASEGLLDLEELRDSCRRERRSSISTCFRSVVGSNISKLAAAAAAELASSSIRERRFTC